MKVLVVEDESYFSTMLSDLLSGEGYEVAVANCGKDGVKLALAFRPDLVMLDYHLGDMTGYDVGTAIRYMAATARTPFILLSSVGADPLRVSSFKKLPNCKAVLVKTSPVTEILGAVESVLKQA